MLIPNSNILCSNLFLLKAENAGMYQMTVVLQANNENIKTNQHTKTVSIQKKNMAQVRESLSGFFFFFLYPGVLEYHMT